MLTRRFYLLPWDLSLGRGVKLFSWHPQIQYRVLLYSAFWKEYGNLPGLGSLSYSDALITLIPAEKEPLCGNATVYAIIIIIIIIIIYYYCHFKMPFPVMCFTCLNLFQHGNISGAGIFCIVSMKKMLSHYLYNTNILVLNPLDKSLVPSSWLKLACSCSRFSPYSQFNKCRICKQVVHQAHSHYCQGLSDYSN